MTRKYSLLLLVAIGCSRAPVDRPQEVSLAPGELPEARPIEIASDEWPGWRGPAGNGIAAEQAVPVAWSAGENIIWSAPVPGRGHSSPTVVGDRIFLETADEGQQIQYVVCFDRANGKQLWQQEVHRGKFESEMHAKNTQATSTIASDGRLLFAPFLNNRAIWVSAFDFDGELVWQTEVGGFQSRFGYSASPLVYGSLVILAADHEGGGFLAALHRETGDVAWLKSRPAKASYASPTVVNVAGEDLLVICGCDQVSAYDPATGNSRWSVDGTTTSTVGTMVSWGDLVIASGGYPGADTVALRPAGNSATVAWRTRQKAYVPSLLAADGLLFMVNDKGVAYCWDVATGTERWKHRVGGNFSASPVLAGGHIYASSERGKTTVFRATGEGYESVAENQLGDEGFASPVICGGRIYLRVADSSSGARRETLYCIGTPAE